MSRLMNGVALGAMAAATLITSGTAMAQDASTAVADSDAIIVTANK
jgi:hypothetical protein